MLLEKFPDIDLEDLRGQRISYEAFKGKKLLIFMWASW
jgi:glutathione peroxidase-family protein